MKLKIIAKPGGDRRFPWPFLLLLIVAIGLWSLLPDQHRAPRRLTLQDLHGCFQMHGHTVIAFFARAVVATPKGPVAMPFRADPVAGTIALPKTLRYDSVAGAFKIVGNQPSTYAVTASGESVSLEDSIGGDHFSFYKGECKGPFGGKFGMR
ncbi:MAG: hypothetical protein JWN66_3134 [Sphingomonas bacterium]|uniref:hypothetical protein n=1 Tax=Sphingomonas bacterium TaxID=1895847 RepID=UPI002634FA50|nr:hypothetical protein [Sphingomonas bacterium]MDB5706018.1 hypothetical protein [Sphingomonas bacterium]